MLEIRTILCWRCSGEVDVPDRFCRHCGASLRHSPPSTVSANGLVDSRIGVLVLLFVVLGPLALPILWRSNRFSRSQKVILSVLVLVVTVAAIVGLWYVIHLTLAELQKLNLGAG